MDGNSNISDLLGAVLSDPEKMKTVMSLLPAVSGILGNPTPPPAKPAGGDLYSDPAVNAAFRNLISAVSAASGGEKKPPEPLGEEKPEAVQTSAIGELLQTAGGNKSGAGNAAEGEKAEKALASLKNFTAATNPEQDERMKLLLALKPFLKDSRKGKIDLAMKYMSAAKILNLFGKNGFV